MSYIVSPVPLVDKRWAHYAVDRVDAGFHPTHIEAVRIREVLSDGSVSIKTLRAPRMWVVQQIDAGFVFKTITETYPGSGRWDIGALVKIEIVRGVKYLTTVANGIAKDNLGNLPPF